ncbi:S8 family serine peptidase [Croceicoccus sp. BE223]|uniref:S8 family serine peptidase n=1 Tax=Croceicoccus sp. BE223 TaxID=2817716 RepID=UPI002866D6A3|nr:S8 family serine peptidase [Croceicoccus sp. BE223]MDR7102872.1 subtilisin family serine protease [Croceicoccus sp. BE223]
MRLRYLLIAGLLAIAIRPAMAQVGLPPVRLPALDSITETIGNTLDDAGAETVRTARDMLRIREIRRAKLMRDHPGQIERDANGDLARAGELFLLDAAPAEIDAARQAGFTVIGHEQIEGLAVDLVRLGIPENLSLKEAEMALGRLLPDTTVSVDTLHFPAGDAGKRVPTTGSSSSARSVRTPVGIIDGAPGRHARPSAMRGFARGAPQPSHHGSAIVSLLDYAGVQDIRVADVYGTDPAGGNAMAIAKALGWLTQTGTKVIAISLVGPRNALLERAIASAQKHGVIIVAAVGNDGPAAPPAYPASYRGVLAVTAVDGRNRALIEAGKADHLDYAAPGADLRVRNADGKATRVRGTSFAVPLVAARAAAHRGEISQIITHLDEEADDLGERGPDRVYGRGLVCGRCRP